MTRTRRIYTAAVLGATGGFAAAVAHQWFIVPQIGGADTWLRQFFLGIALGAIVGAPIGFFQRYFDGISRHSFSVAARIGLMGALVGAAGGLTVFWLSEYLHHAVSGGYVGRAISVGLFGLSIGAAEALSGGSKRWRGLAGGLVGGILAGLLLEFLLRNFQDPDSAIIALMLLGTCIVASVAIFVEVMPDAVLDGLAGPKVVGQVYQIGRFQNQEAVIGSGKNCYIWVPDALPAHAGVSVTPDGGRIRALHPKAEILVNDRPEKDYQLQDGDKIEIGSARFQYRLHPRREGRRKVKFLEQRPGKRAGAGVSLLGFLLLTWGAPLAVSADYTVEVRRVAILRDGRVTGSVLILDPQGKPLTDRLPVKLSIYENSQLRSAKIISSGRAASSVLALDVSGSMTRKKLDAARTSALAFIEQAQPADQIAIVTFTNTPHITADFTADRSQLRGNLQQLTTRGGRTAVADALATSIEIVKQRPGRRSVVLLTDGIDNASRTIPEGVAELARQSDVTITVIGLGKDVNSAYLNRFGGQYLFAPAPEDLEPLFRQVAAALAAEHDFEFVSPLPLDGTRRHITARVQVGAGQIVETAKNPVAPRFLPAVSGRLWLYASIVALLLLTIIPPRLISDVAGPGHVWRIEPGSKMIGRIDGNRRKLLVNDPVVQCPTCQHCHHVRSWRLNKCRCFNDKTELRVCRHRILPKWARQSLDKMSGGATGPAGRRWLCNCEGDPDGY